MTRREAAQAAWKPEGIKLEPAAFTATKSDTNQLVIAGPGAGKTEMLAQRACYLLQTGTCPAPYRILAISFKRDAAENLKARVILRSGRELAARLDSYTFDAFAKDLLDRFRCGLPADLRPSADYQIITGADAGDERLRQKMLDVSLDHLTLPTAQRQQITGAQLRSGMVGRRLPPAEWPAASHFAAGAGLWRSLLTAAPSQLTFAMVNRLAELLLRSNPNLVAALRDTYRYVFLDEFQDTTALQCELVETCFLGTNTVLTAVGDSKQRIMGWAGALSGIFERYRRTFAASVVPLTKNYRSRSRLVAIQSVFAAELDPTAAAVASARTGDETGECQVMEFRNEDGEAGHLAEKIQTLIGEGIPPEEICVLCRARPDQFAAALVTRLKAGGIGVKVEVNRRETLGEPVAALLLNMLALVFADAAPDAWEHVSAVVSDLRGDSDELAATRTRCDLLEFFASLRPTFENGDGSAKQIAEALERMLAFIGRDQYAALHPQYAQGDYLDDVLSQLAELIAEDLPSAGWPGIVDAVKGVGAVSVMTMHKSKGLEFDTVIFLGLEDGSIWNYQSNPEEETCGLFVALSRAKERCYFTFCRSRTNRWGNAQAQQRLTLNRVYELFAEAGVVVERIGQGRES